MKNYKQIVPIVLVVIFVLSVYMLWDTKADVETRYNQKIEEARAFRQQGIVVDAENCYKEALAEKESMDLCLEIGSLYVEAGLVEESVDWGEDMIKAHPKDVRGYEYLIGIYRAQEDYAELYSLADTYEKRRLTSEMIDQILEECRNVYFFSGKYAEVGAFSEGFCPVRIKQYWGYADQTGDQVIKAMYQKAGPFSDGVAAIADSKWSAYFIDGNGNKKHVLMNAGNIQEVRFMDGEMFSAFNGQTWSFYNKKHELVFGAYSDVSAMANGVVAVKSNGWWSLIDRQGNDLTGKAYADVVQDDKGIVCRKDRIFVSDGTGYRLINTKGEQIGNQTFEKAMLFNDDTYAAVRIGGQWGFVDLDGNKVLGTYEEARSFSNGYAAVKVGGLWGYIDLEGNMVVDPIFEDARDFNSDGGAFVKMEENWRLLRFYRTNH